MRGECAPVPRRAARDLPQRIRSGAIAAAHLDKPRAPEDHGGGRTRTDALRQAAAQDGSYVHGGPQPRSSGGFQVATVHLLTRHGQAHQSASPPLACALLAMPAHPWSEEMGV